MCHETAIESNSGPASNNSIRCCPPTPRRSEASHSCFSRLVRPLGFILALEASSFNGSSSSSFSISKSSRGASTGSTLSPSGARSVPCSECSLDPKPKNKKLRTTNKQRGSACETSQSRWRSSQRIWRIQKCQHPHTLPMTQIRNILRKWHPGSTVLKLISQKTEIAKSANEQR